jgi:hypothetical protein
VSTNICKRLVSLSKLVVSLSKLVLSGGDWCLQYIGVYKDL